jgi:predicted  nucleic acid-binding Zn-ribbon protein
MSSGQRCGHCRSEGHNVRTCPGFRAELHEVQEDITITRRAVARLREMFRQKNERIYDLEIEVRDLCGTIRAQESKITKLESELAAAHVIVATQDSLIDAYAKEVGVLREQLAEAKYVLASLSRK